MQISSPANPHRGYRFPEEIIAPQCVWLYCNFCVSFRDVELMMAFREPSCCSALPWASAPPNVTARDVADVVSTAEGLVAKRRRSTSDPEGQGREVGIPYGSTLHLPGPSPHQLEDQRRPFPCAPASSP
jgi:hypothetical protein